MHAYPGSADDPAVYEVRSRSHAVTCGRNTGDEVMMKCAVIYYSNSGITRKIAEKVQAAFDADIYAVEPEKAYGGYISAVVRAGLELLVGRAPALKGAVADFSSCDVVFIGFPVWYGTLPKFLQDYINRAGLAGKRVIPFATAGANGKESSLKTLKKLLPDSEITDYFYTSRKEVADPDAWIKGIKL